MVSPNLYGSNDALQLIFSSPYPSVLQVSSWSLEHNFWGTCTNLGIFKSLYTFITTEILIIWQTRCRHCRGQEKLRWWRVSAVKSSSCRAWSIAKQKNSPKPTVHNSIGSWSHRCGWPWSPDRQANSAWPNTHTINLIASSIEYLTWPKTLW